MMTARGDGRIPRLATRKMRGTRRPTVHLVRLVSQLMGYGEMGCHGKKSRRATRDSPTGERGKERALARDSVPPFSEASGNRELGFDLGERGKKGDQGAYELGKTQAAISPLPSAYVCSHVKEAGERRGVRAREGGQRCWMSRPPSCHPSVQPACR